MCLSLYTPQNCTLQARVGKMSSGGKCHMCTAVDESYTIAQWSAYLPSKQVPGSSLGGAIRHSSDLACKV